MKLYVADDASTTCSLSGAVLLEGGTWPEATVLPTDATIESGRDAIAQTLPTSLTAGVTNAPIDAIQMTGGL